VKINYAAKIKKIGELKDLKVNFLLGFLVGNQIG